LTVSKGTALAEELAHRYRKPLLIVDLSDSEPVEKASLWLRVQQRRVGADLALAMGGPRESEAPGIYAHATAFLHALIDLAERADGR
jgi:hypothetical protein